MKLVVAAYKSFNKIIRTFVHLTELIRTRIKLYGNGVRVPGFRSNGVPYVMVARGAKGMSIGENFACKLSHNANLVAKRRHNKEYVCRQYEDIYKEVVNMHKQIK